MTSPDPHPSPKERHLRPLQTRKTRIVCIADTHNQTPKLPPGDVLIHAGDLTNQGSYGELKRAVEWLEKQGGFEVKIVVAGMYYLPTYLLHHPLFLPLLLRFNMNLHSSYSY